MANEVRVTAGLLVNKPPLSYQSLPQSWQGNLSVARGPSPGVIKATYQGTNVDFSQLTLPGYGRIMNLDPTDGTGVPITYGVYAADINRFLPIHEVLPGETYPFRISRHLHAEEYTTGTGSFPEPGNRLQIRSESPTHNVQVLIEVFDAAAS